MRLSILLAVILCFDANAFEIDGFETGQTPQKVRMVIAEYGLAVSEGSGMVFAMEGRKVKYAFNFCDEKLVSVQKELTPSFTSFVEVTEQMKNLYSDGVGSVRGPNRTSKVQDHYVIWQWTVGHDQISIRFGMVEVNGKSNDYHNLYYLTRNRCFGVRM